jgi:uncharacterized coiled-coil protein SlyX
MVLPYDNMDYGEDQVGARTIPELTDVLLTNLANGELLAYNSTTEKWENITITDVDTLDNLIDTNITPPILNGSSLVYNTTSSKWENEVLVDIDTLSNLSDTNISSLANQDFLLYDSVSSKWINTSSNIDNLKNITITTVANNEILKYNSTTSNWENNNLLINEIQDVNITSLQNGEVLKYNSSSSKWENQNNTDTLNELTDVTLTGINNNQVLKYNGSLWVNNYVNLTELADTNIPALNNGDILRYNNVSQKWETDTFNIDDLDNVNITSVANNEVLKYNSTTSKWENSNRIDTLDELGDVTLTAVTTGDLLRYNGSVFVNTKIALDNDFTNVNFGTLANGDLIKYDGSNFINFSPTYLDGAGIVDNNLIKVVSGATTATSLFETSVLNTSTSLRIYIPLAVLNVIGGSIETEIFDTTKKRMLLTTDGIATTNGITITSDGRVGIGVIEPDEVLQIDGKLRIENDTTQTLTFYDTAGSTKEHARIEVNDNVGGADIIFYTRPSSGTPPTEKLRINKNGAIGIGGATYGTTNQVLVSNGSGSSVSWANQTNTTYSSGIGVSISPSNVISIGQAVARTNSPIFTQLTIGNSGANQGILNFQDFINFGTETVAQIKGIKEGTSGGKLQFFTKVDGGSLTERLSISQAGNVGIGTIAPRARLDVVGGGGVWIENADGNITHFNLNNLNLNFIRGHLEVTNSSKICLMGAQDGGTNRGLYFFTLADTNWGQYMGTPGLGKSFSGGAATGGWGFGSFAMRFRVAAVTTHGWIFENSSEGLAFSVRADGLGYFAGQVYSVSAYLTSDDRIKFNEKSLTDGLEVIRQLVPQEYMKSKKINVEEDLEKEIGLIAQEVKEIPQLEHVVVGEPDNPEGILNVNYIQIFVYGLQAIKELDTIVTKQQETINGLDAIVSKQQETINGLDVIVTKQQETINGLDAIVSKQQETINGLIARIETLENNV